MQHVKNDSMNELESKMNFIRDTFGVKDDSMLAHIAEKLRYIKKKRRNIRITDRYNDEYSYFLISGCVKSIYIISDDEEYVESFIKVGEMVNTDSNYYLNDYYEVETYTTCPAEFYRIRKSDFDKLLLTCPEIKRKFDLQNIHRAEATRKIKYAISTMTCLERFKWFINTYSNYMEHLTHDDIASILSIRKTHLSYLVNKDENI